MNMKKQLLQVILMFLPMVASADTVQIDGIYYELGIPSMTKATVTVNPKYYSGNVVIPEIVNYNGKEYSVTCIGQGAFSYCNGLTSITIPQSITTIEAFAFESCSGLTSLTIPNSVTHIQEWAFVNCTGLTSVTLSNSLIAIGAESFANCEKLTSINIPNSVTTILGEAFLNCSGLTSVEIPNSVTNIGTSSFENCYGLTNIKIPFSVKTIGKAAFKGCSNLTSVVVEMEMPVSITENVFTNRVNATLYVPAGSKATYETADYWKEFMEIIESSPIIDFADANVKALCVANWDTNSDGELSKAEAAAVTSLQRRFQQNDQISSFDELQYFTGLSSLAEEEFALCYNLKSIVLPASLTSIGERSFSGCI